MITKKYTFFIYIFWKFDSIVVVSWRPIYFFRSSPIQYWCPLCKCKAFPRSWNGLSENSIQTRYWSLLSFWRTRNPAQTRRVRLISKTFFVWIIQCSWGNVMIWKSAEKLLPQILTRWTNVNFKRKSSWLSWEQFSTQTFNQIMFIEQVWSVL